MKHSIKIYLSFLLVIILIFASGCRFPSPEILPEETTEETITMVTKEMYNNAPDAYVKFNRSSGVMYEYVPIKELTEYRSQYADCNGTHYKNKLSGENLVIYNSFLYALENRFIGFTIYVEDSDRNFSWIRELLSLDSPFLEQNYSQYESINKWPINHIGESIYVSMEQFTDSRWEMKLEALEKCREIVAGIPEELETRLQKMEYLYDYVCEHIEYTDYEEIVDESFFYDAVCNGKSNCDGYSNMLLILFNLIGAEACEVMSFDEDDESGHTWVVAKIGENYYNFDPTFEDTDDIDSTNRVYFGFSDRSIYPDDISHVNYRPICHDKSRDFLFADIVVENLYDTEEIDKVVNVIKQRKSEGIYETLFVVKKELERERLESFSEALLYTYGGFYSVEMSYGTGRDTTIIKITVG